MLWTVRWWLPCIATTNLGTWQNLIPVHPTNLTNSPHLTFQLLKDPFPVRLFNTGNLQSNHVHVHPFHNVVHSETGHARLADTWRAKPPSFTKMVWITTGFTKLHDLQHPNGDPDANFSNPTSAGETSHGISSMFTLIKTFRPKQTHPCSPWIPDESVIQDIPDCLHPPKHCWFVWSTFFWREHLPPGDPTAGTWEAPFHSTLWSPSKICG